MRAKSSLCANLIVWDSNIFYSEILHKTHKCFQRNGTKILERLVSDFTSYREGKLTKWEIQALRSYFTGLEVDSTISNCVYRDRSKFEFLLPNSNKLTYEIANKQFFSHSEMLNRKGKQNCGKKYLCVWNIFKLIR